MTQKIYMAGPSITEHEIKTVADAMQNGWYENAYDYVEKFEREFATYHDRKFALMTPNCTAAIHLTLMGLGIKGGDEVIVPDCTWIASAAPIVYTGATPVLGDIDPNNWCLAPESILQRITPNTKAIIMVDLYGNMPNYDLITKIASDNNLHLIEDAAESLGSTYKGVKAGKFGIASVFSFHRTKTLTTGEGGMMLTDSEELYKRCKFLRDHGRKEGEMYFNTEVAYKYMPFNVQAALGYAQFQRLDELVGKKRMILNWYRNYLKDIPDIGLNPEPDQGVNGVWCTTLVWDKKYKLPKKEFIKRMDALGFTIRPFFYPLSSMPAFTKWAGNAQKTNLCAFDISERGVNLPSALNIEESQVALVSQAIKQVFKEVKS
jgi:perosamine synthetase